MSKKTRSEQVAKPLFEIDRKARRLFKPYADSPAVGAIGTVGSAGDQLPLRIVSAGVFAIGLLRRDGRMMRAGVRMLLAHELATLAKNAVKRRVDRSRPRSNARTKPKEGHHTGKEITSFPSGHSAGSMAVASAFAAEYPEHRVAALTAGATLGVAQIPTGAHYPSDVAAGMAIGALAERVIGFVWRKLLGAHSQVPPVRD